tara:strand:+ start:190 stop:393 length:204 start_codon:yes stop_codon:yes gene_type:complete
MSETSKNNLEKNLDDNLLKAYKTIENLISDLNNKEEKDATTDEIIDLLNKFKDELILTSEHFTLEEE